jgi:hypothetical protein
MTDITKQELEIMKKQLAQMQAAEAERIERDKKREAELEAYRERERLEAERREAMERNGGYLPGVHDFGFNCLLDPSDTKNVKYCPERKTHLGTAWAPFRVEKPTLVYIGARNGTVTQRGVDRVITYGPALLLMSPGNHELTSSPRNTETYLWVKSGSKNTRFSGEPKHSQLGMLWQLITADRKFHERHDVWVSQEYTPFAPLTGALLGDTLLDADDKPLDWASARALIWEEISEWYAQLPGAKSAPRTKLQRAGVHI